MTIIVGIATSGRRDILSHTLSQIDLQSYRATKILVAPASLDDVDLEHCRSLQTPVEIVMGSRGLCAQRNTILDAAKSVGLIVFFDDDFLPARSFLEEAARLFADQSDIVGATGKVLADGIHGPGLTVDEGLLRLAQDDGADSLQLPKTVFNTYGCNMVFRAAAIDAKGARFDEVMPLYGWQEDVDFSRQIADLGRIVHCRALRGVHLGNKKGRTPGVRLGYSQVANPIYLLGKGSVHLRWALNLMSRNIAANIAGSLRTQGLVDRRGRLKGNLLACRDLVLGKISPQRMLLF